MALSGLTSPRMSPACRGPGPQGVRQETWAGWKGAAGGLAASVGNKLQAVGCGGTFPADCKAAEWFHLFKCSPTALGSALPGTP